MPFDKLTCPDCNTVLKPASPVAEGKKVKCPKCSNIFVAGGGKFTAGDGSKKRADGAAAQQAPGAAASKSEEYDAQDTYGFAASEEPEVKKPESAPAKKKKRRRDDEDEDEDEDDEDEDEDEEEKGDPILEMYLKQNRSTDPRGPATFIITGPSNKLIIVYGLMMLLQLFAITYWLFPLVFADHLVTSGELRETVDGKPLPYFRTNDSKPILPEKTWDELEKAVDNSKTRPNDRERFEDALDQMRSIDRERAAERRIQVIFPFLMLIYCAVIVYGGVKMQSLESYGWAWTATIMAILPIGFIGGSWTWVYALWRLLGPVDFLDFCICCGGGCWFWWAWIGYGLVALIGAIMSIVAMCNPVVKDAFFYVEE